MSNFNEEPNTKTNEPVSVNETETPTTDDRRVSSGEPEKETTAEKTNISLETNEHTPSNDVEPTRTEMMTACDGENKMTNHDCVNEGLVNSADISCNETVECVTEKTADEVCESASSSDRLTSTDETNASDDFKGACTTEETVEMANPTEAVDEGDSALPRFTSEAIGQLNNETVEVNVEQTSVNETNEYSSVNNEYDYSAAPVLTNANDQPINNELMNEEPSLYVADRPIKVERISTPTAYRSIKPADRPIKVERISTSTPNRPIKSEIVTAIATNQLIKKELISTVPTSRLLKRELLTEDSVNSEFIINESMDSEVVSGDTIIGIMEEEIPRPDEEPVEPPVPEPVTSRDVINKLPDSITRRFKLSSLPDSVGEKSSKCSPTRTKAEISKSSATKTESGKSIRVKSDLGREMPKLEREMPRIVPKPDPERFSNRPILKQEPGRQNEDPDYELFRGFNGSEQLGLVIKDVTSQAGQTGNSYQSDSQQFGTDEEIRRFEAIAKIRPRMRKQDLSVRRLKGVSTTLMPATLELPDPDDPFVGNYANQRVFNRPPEPGDLLIEKKRPGRPRTTNYLSSVSQTNALNRNKPIQKATKKPGRPVVNKAAQNRSSSATNSNRSVINKPGASGDRKQSPLPASLNSRKQNSVLNKSTPSTSTQQIKPPLKKPAPAVARRSLPNNVAKQKKSATSDSESSASAASSKSGASSKRKTVEKKSTAQQIAKPPSNLAWRGVQKPGPHSKTRKSVLKSFKVVSKKYGIFTAKQASYSFQHYLIKNKPVVLVENFKFNDVDSKFRVWLENDRSKSLRKLDARAGNASENTVQKYCSKEISNKEKSNVCKDDKKSQKTHSKTESGRKSSKVDPSKTRDEMKSPSKSGSGNEESNNWPYLNAVFLNAGPDPLADSTSDQRGEMPMQSNFFMSPSLPKETIQSIQDMRETQVSKPSLAVCRLCGEKGDNRISLLGKEAYRMHLLQFLSTYLNVTVKLDDFLPLHICTVCSSVLTSFDEFANRVKVTEQRLSHLVNDLSRQTGSFGWEVIPWYSDNLLAKVSAVPQQIPSSTSSASTPQSAAMSPSMIVVPVMQTANVVTPPPAVMTSPSSASLAQAPPSTPEKQKTTTASKQQKQSAAQPRASKRKAAEETAPPSSKSEQKAAEQSSDANSTSRNLRKRTYFPIIDLEDDEIDPPDTVATPKSPPSKVRKLSSEDEAYRPITKKKSPPQKRRKSDQKSDNEPVFEEVKHLKKLKIKPLIPPIKDDDVQIVDSVPASSKTTPALLKKIKPKNSSKTGTGVTGDTNPNDKYTYVVKISSDAKKNTPYYILTNAPATVENAVLVADKIGILSKESLNQSKLSEGDKIISSHWSKNVKWLSQFKVSGNVDSLVSQSPDALMAHLAKQEKTSALPRNAQKMRQTISERFSRLTNPPPSQGAVPVSAPTPTHLFTPGGKTISVANISAIPQGDPRLAVVIGTPTKMPSSSDAGNYEYFDGEVTCEPEGRDEQAEDGGSGAPAIRQPVDVIDLDSDNENDVYCAEERSDDASSDRTNDCTTVPNSNVQIRENSGILNRFVIDPSIEQCDNSVKNAEVTEETNAVNIKKDGHCRSSNFVHNIDSAEATDNNYSSYRNRERHSSVNLCNNNSNSSLKLNDLAVSNEEKKQADAGIELENTSDPPGVAGIEMEISESNADSQFDSDDAISLSPWSDALSAGDLSDISSNLSDLSRVDDESEVAKFNSDSHFDLDVPSSSSDVLSTGDLSDISDSDLSAKSSAMSRCKKQKANKGRDKKKRTTLCEEDKKENRNNEGVLSKSGENDSRPPLAEASLTPDKKIVNHTETTDSDRADNGSRIRTEPIGIKSTGEANGRELSDGFLVLDNGIKDKEDIRKGCAFCGKSYRGAKDVEAHVYRHAKEDPQLFGSKMLGLNNPAWIKKYSCLLAEWYSKHLSDKKHNQHFSECIKCEVRRQIPHIPERELPQDDCDKTEIGSTQQKPKDISFSKKKYIFCSFCNSFIWDLLAPQHYKEIHDTIALVCAPCSCVYLTETVEERDRLIPNHILKHGGHTHSKLPSFIQEKPVAQCELYRTSDDVILVRDFIPPIVVDDVPADHANKKRMVKALEFYYDFIRFEKVNCDVRCGMLISSDDSLYCRECDGFGIWRGDIVEHYKSVHSSAIVYCDFCCLIFPYDTSAVRELVDRHLELHRHTVGPADLDILTNVCHLYQLSWNSDREMKDSTASGFILSKRVPPTVRERLKLVPPSAFTQRSHCLIQAMPTETRKWFVRLDPADILEKGHAPVWYKTKPANYDGQKKYTTCTVKGESGILKNTQTANTSTDLKSTNFPTYFPTWEILSDPQNSTASQNIEDLTASQIVTAMTRAAQAATHLSPDSKIRLFLSARVELDHNYSFPVVFCSECEMFLENREMSERHKICCSSNKLYKCMLPGDKKPKFFKYDETLNETEHHRELKIQTARKQLNRKRKPTEKKPKPLKLERKKPLKFMCEFCGKMFNWKVFKWHRHSKHGVEYELTVKCTAKGCDKLFIDSCQMHNHKNRKHTTKMCDICGALVKASYLYKHRKRHIKKRVQENTHRAVNLKKRKNRIINADRKLKIENTNNCPIDDGTFDIIPENKVAAGDEVGASATEVSTLLCGDQSETNVDFQHQTNDVDLKSGLDLVILENKVLRLPFNVDQNAEVVSDQSEVLIKNISRDTNYAKPRRKLETAVFSGNKSKSVSRPDTKRKDALKKRKPVSIKNRSGNISVLQFKSMEPIKLVRSMAIINGQPYLVDGDFGETIAPADCVSDVGNKSMPEL